MPVERRWYLSRLYPGYWIQTHFNQRISCFKKKEKKKKENEKRKKKKKKKSWFSFQLLEVNLFGVRLKEDSV